MGTSKNSTQDPVPRSRRRAAFKPTNFQDRPVDPLASLSMQEWGLYMHLTINGAGHRAALFQMGRADLLSVNSDG